MVDLDNDGLPDLFVVTGSVYPEVEKTLPAYPNSHAARWCSATSAKARFEELIDEAGSGVSATHASRGCAFGDFDNDGDVDILVMNMNEPPSLLRNDVTGGGHWLKVLLAGVKSNAQRDRRPRRRQLRRPHAGAGSARAIELLLRQRSPPPFRSWRGDVSGSNRALAERRHREDRKYPRRSTRRHPRRRRYRPAPEVRPLRSPALDSLASGQPLPRQVACR